MPQVAKNLYHHHHLLCAALLASPLQTAMGGRRTGRAFVSSGVGSCYCRHLLSRSPPLHYLQCWHYACLDVIQSSTGLTSAAPRWSSVPRPEKITTYLVRFALCRARLFAQRVCKKGENPLKLPDHRTTPMAGVSHGREIGAWGLGRARARIHRSFQTLQ